jgi:hypothetical protein
MNERVFPWALPLAFGLAGCGSSSQPGIEVTVISAAAALEPDEALPSVDGQELRLSELFWTTTAVELVPCDSLARRVWDAIVPSAHAHGVTSPRRLSVPVVERASQREPLTLGTLRPAAGRYCSVRYEVGTADSDAVGLDAAPEMQGHSVDAVGAFRPSDAELQGFEITSGVAFHVICPVDLDLSEETPRATLRIERRKADWFVGIAFAELDAAEQERRLLDNLAAATAIHVE